MSMAATMALEPTRSPAIAKAALLRLEGLGDNCEFGFVLRRLGFEDGMLFRWASIRPESLLATLRGDFSNLYEFDNLVPQNSKMVRDLHYGTSWHTQMYSSLRAGTLTFDADEDRRRVIHAREASKLAYLLQKLAAKFEHPNPVFVIKANSGIAADLLEAIHYQIYRRATSPRFLLLEVQDNAGRAGTVDLLDRNRMRGYVARFASYDKSDEGDDANWIAVLGQALAHNANPPPTSAAAMPVNTPNVVTLPFPHGAGPDLLAPVPGDLRGGLPALIHGNVWCRMVDEDTYRLHAISSEPAATTLQWSGVNLPPNYVLTIQAACAIEESLPVRATLQILGADGTRLRNQFIFSTTQEREVSLPGPVSLVNPLRFSLSVEPVTPLKMGERAVIDITSVTAAPARGNSQLPG